MADFPFDLSEDDPFKDIDVYLVMPMSRTERLCPDCYQWHAGECD